MKHVKLPDLDDSWAKAQLFRWQYGASPEPDDNRELNVSEGLKAMSKAIRGGLDAGSYENMPSPYNISTVLDYCAKRLKE